MSHYLSLLVSLIAISKTNLPKVLAILDQITALLEAVVPTASPDALQDYAPSPEVLEAEGQLSQALSADGAECVFDGSRLRKLLSLAGEYGPTIISLIKLFSGA